MHLRTVIAVCLFICAGIFGITSSATAATLDSRSTVTDPQLIGWLSQGESYWKQSLPDCPNGIVLGAADAPASNPNAVAAASLGGCTVNVMSTWYPKLASITTFKWETTMCNALVHEYGHLLGYEHSDNPADVMYPRQNDANYVPGCFSQAPVFELEPGNGADDGDVEELSPASLVTHATIKRNKKTRRTSIRVTVTNNGERQSRPFTVCVGASKAVARSYSVYKKNGSRLCLKYQPLAADGERVRVFKFSGLARSTARARISVVQR